MTVGQLDIVDAVAGITDTSGELHLVEATADPVLCGPCALVRWRRILDIEVGGTSTKVLARKLKNAKTVTPASRHVCRTPAPIRVKTEAAALFPPINQWGHLPAPIYPLSRHAVSILARQVQTGLPAHRDLHVDDVADVLNLAEPVAAEPTVPRPAWDWAAANQKKKEAIVQLASLSAAMDDIDARIDELAERTRNLDLDCCVLFVRRAITGHLTGQVLRDDQRGGCNCGSLIALFTTQDLMSHTAAADPHLEAK